jgi:hypothetical protein
MRSLIGVPRGDACQEESIFYSLIRSARSSSCHVGPRLTSSSGPRALARLLPAIALVSAVGCGADVDTDEMTNPSDPLVRFVDGGDVASDAGTSTHVDGKVPTTPQSTRDADIVQSCGSLNINAVPNAPEVLIVLDRSGSMIGNGSKTLRWEPSVSAVKKITKELEQQMQFGLMVFPQPLADVANVCAPGVLNVPPALGNATKIASTVDSSAPTWNSATPTAAALQTALETIGAAETCADCVAPMKYVLLVTDGAPNCGSDKHTDTRAADVTECNGKLDALKNQGVLTYVIGYDTTVAKNPSLAATMDGFAMHGGTGKQLPVEDEASLLQTLTKVAGQLVACDYQLASEVDDASYVRVTIDGVQVDLGTGWSLKEDKRTIVLGSACEKLRDAKPHNLQITRECTQVIAI